MIASDHWHHSCGWAADAGAALRRSVDRAKRSARIFVGPALPWVSVSCAVASAALLNIHRGCPAGRVEKNTRRK